MHEGFLSPLQLFIKQKWVRALLLLNAIVIIIILIIVIINTAKTSIVSFNVTPIDATISVNGNTNYENGDYSFMPGSYTITISHSQLDTKTIQIDIPSHHDIKISVFLSNSENDLSFYTQKDNLKSYEKLREIASSNNNITFDHDKSAEQFISYYQENYKIYEMLPIIDFTPSQYGKSGGVRYETDTLTIADGRTLTECSTIMCLYITDTSGEKEKFALSVIEKNGFDPKAYQIIYRKIDYED